MEDKINKKDSALNVQKGIEQPDIIDFNSIKRFKENRKKLKTIDEYFEGITSGDISTLGSAITLIESSLPEHQLIAREIIGKCLPKSGNSIRIGITGVPGVGKSSFIETFGMFLIENKKKIAVLAIDPSSERTSGSILGDKTRMEQLSASRKAFIRPSPSAGSLGGVARKTAESVILCEAAGYNIIIIETVGVGQSETAVNSMVDFFMLLMLAGAGDELQGIKRGIMEMADSIIINKADGDNINKANLAKTEYQNALHLFPASHSGWFPKVLTASGHYKLGISEVWNLIENYVKHTKSNGYFDEKRASQSKFRMNEMINEKLKENFYYNAERELKIKEIENQVISGKISPYFGANVLLTEYFNL